jgi:hypothetical protein
MIIFIIFFKITAQSRPTGIDLTRIAGASLYVQITSAHGTKAFAILLTEKTERHLCEDLIADHLRKIQPAVLQQKELLLILVGKPLCHLVRQKKLQTDRKLLTASPATGNALQGCLAAQGQVAGVVFRRALYENLCGGQIIGKLCTGIFKGKGNGVYNPDNQLTKIKNHGKTPHFANTDPGTQFIPLYLFAFDLSMVFLLFLREKNAFFAKTVARRGEMW